MVNRENLKQIKRHRLITKIDPNTKPDTMYRSEFCLTDNDTIAIFGEELIETYLKDKKIKSYETFLLTEENLDIKIDRNKMLEPTEDSGMAIFDQVGKVDIKTIEWFAMLYPKCVIYPVKEWFGQKTNALICILGSLHGKPVGVVKTIN